MLDINFIRQNPKLVEEGARSKGFKINIGELLEVDKKRRKLKKQVDKLREKRNKITGKVKKCGNKKERKRLIKQGKNVKERLARVEHKFRAVREKWQKLMLQVPNVPDPEAPVGEDETGNKTVREWGKKPDFDFEPKDHLKLGETLNIIDLKRGAKVSGNNFYYLKDKGAYLQWALMSFAIDKVKGEGFSLMIVPDLVKKEAMVGTGFLPAEEREIYRLKKDDLYLIGTAEVPLGAYRAEEILKAQDLPLRYAGFSACFRREAGAYGKKSKGIYRVHQFHKVELFVICHPDEGESIFKEILGISEELMQEINLPYRVVYNCTGDMGFPQRKKYDIETWMPGRGEYGETHSCSLDTDFQARRLKIRFREDKETKFAYTLNNTLVAERLLIAILENYQQKDGSVKVPKVLRAYCGFEEIRP